MSSFSKFYSRLLKFHPWKTQLITTGLLMGSSDIVSQTLIEKRSMKEIEVKRISRFALMGLCFVGPVLKVWYVTLEKIIGNVGRAAGLKKMLIDQFLFAPCFIGSFITVLGTFQLQPWHITKYKDYFRILKTNYMLWPGAQLITFYLIPLQMRVVFVSFIALLWNTYLASQANRN